MSPSLAVAYFLITVALSMHGTTRNHILVHYFCLDPSILTASYSTIFPNLKKIGFIFLDEVRIQKWTKNSIKSRMFKHIEEKKRLQIKRRFKKQRRETRRRTKRKRFYPRPIWLRFKMYENFLKVRHSQLTFLSGNHSELRQKDNLNLKFNLNENSIKTFADEK